MLRPFATYLAQLDSTYGERPYLVGLRARILAIFCWMLLVLVPLNIVKLLWLNPPVVFYRILFNIFMAAACALALRWSRRGRLEAAGNMLVLGTVIPAHVLALLVPAYEQPVSAAILLFAFDLVFLLFALVFSSRRVSLAVLLVVVFSRIAFHLRELSTEPIAGSLKFAADALLREGLVVIAVIYCLGLALMRMIESAHRRSEESLIETRRTNENLGRLVAERTRDLEAASLRANEASRAKGDFLANMSHEIRTPLNGIIASADLLMRRSDLSPEAFEQVRLIADSGELLLKQLSDILDFSKIEAGQFMLETRRFEPAALVADCVTLLRAKADQGEVRVESSVDASLPRYLEGDSYRLRQVLLNLISNAIKFTPPGGEVRVVVSSVLPASDPVPVRFEVIDTGIGMDADTMKRMFERFTQADSSTTRRYGGTGLGLAISSRIVAMMSGRIEAESQLGKGTRFHFTLPFRINSTPPEVSVASPRGSVRLGLHVLVAEDNAMNRKIIGVQLGELGCSYDMA
ncbi:MAG TPA: ATP-binding protein, partial [Rariglobus sp.]